MMQYNKKNKRPNTVNITSLIDVIFMLVIFFMIGSSFDKNAIPVSLPSATTETETPTESLSVTIDALENIYVNDILCEGEQIQEETERLLATLQEKNAVLYSDETIQLATVVSIIEILHKGGVEHVAIKTHSP